MNKKWCWHTFFIKITSQAFFAWLVSNVMTFMMCWKNGDHSWLDILVVGNITITCLFIGGKVLVDAIATAISKAEIKAELGK